MVKKNETVNKQATLKRVLTYIFRFYKWRFLLVVVLILLSALCFL